MERLLGIRRIYTPLRWLLVGFLLLLVAVPLLQKCVLGILQGESCKWRPAWSFFTTYWIWIVLALLLLGVILFVSWRAELRYQERQREQERLQQEDQRQQERLQQAHERFELMKPVSKLRPEDLRFHLVERGDSEIEEVVAQDERPYHEHDYVPRTAIDYAALGRPDPQPRYTEERLVELLRNGKGFTLQGQPTDGKSRTIYEVIRRMDGYHVVSPKLKDGLSHEDIGLLLKGRKIVLLLDDLTNYVGAGLDLRELGKSLNRNQVSWVVASTCRDGPQLESVRTAQTEGLGTFYENIPLKLKLLELTTAEKGLLAQNIGREWDSGEGEQYPTPGSITMENYKIYICTSGSRVSTSLPYRETRSGRSSC
jgi:membrane protein implicated in regulation of membrane protease activity